MSVTRNGSQKKKGQLNEKLSIVRKLSDDSARFPYKYHRSVNALVFKTPKYFPILQCLELPSYMKPVKKKMGKLLQYPSNVKVHVWKILKCLILKLHNLQSYRSSPRLTVDMLKYNLKKIIQILEIFWRIYLIKKQKKWQRSEKLFNSIKLPRTDLVPSDK